MADVRPFRGLRYNTGTVGDLSPIVCPPFDTIPPQLQQSLYLRSPYNVIRLEAGEVQPSDSPNDNRYTRSAALLSQWIESGVLLREDEPCFYLVQHGFRAQGRERRRTELMAHVRLEEYAHRVVLPHEYTRDRDKRDRLALMEACHANFSPIMCLYKDPGGRLASLSQTAMAVEPLMEFSDAGDQSYRFWKIAERGPIDEISEMLSSGPLYIADGHHRYETALDYRARMASSSPAGGSEDEAFDFVMMGLISFDDPGLMVLPYHRVVGGLDEAGLARVEEALLDIFDERPFPVSQEGGGLEDLLEEIEVRGRSQLMMGLLDPRPGRGYRLLSLKRGSEAEGSGPLARSEAWVLEQRVLRPVLGDSLSPGLDYLHDVDEAERDVRQGKFQLAVFLKSFPLDLFKTIVDAGERLPPKSTFFFPKLPTGVVMNLLDGKI